MPSSSPATFWTSAVSAAVSVPPSVRSKTSSAADAGLLRERVSLELGGPDRLVLRREEFRLVGRGAQLRRRQDDQDGRDDPPDDDVPRMTCGQPAECPEHAPEPATDTVEGVARICGEGRQLASYTCGRRRPNGVGPPHVCVNRTAASQGVRCHDPRTCVPVVGTWVGAVTSASSPSRARSTPG